MFREFERLILARIVFSSYLFVRPKNYSVYYNMMIAHIAKICDAHIHLHVQVN